MGLFSSNNEPKHITDWHPAQLANHYSKHDIDRLHAGTVAEAYVGYLYENSIVLADKIDNLNDNLNKLNRNISAMHIKIKQLEEHNAQLENEIRNFTEHTR